MNPLVKKYGIKFGLMIAALSVGYYLVAYLFNEELFVNWYIGIVLIVINFVLLLMSVISVKKEQNGFIEFKDAFSVFALSWIVNAGITMVFTILLFNVIDTELATRVVDMTIEATLSIMEKFNTPEEAIDKAIEDIQAQNNYSVGGIIKGNLISIVVASVFGLIVAAFFKKKKPIFEDTVD